MATQIYLFLVYLLINLISPTKSSPHFINGFFGRHVISFTRLWVANPHVFLTCITRFVSILHVHVHSWPPISNIQYFHCKMASWRSFMQFFHHHLCFCCCQTLSHFVVLAHYVEFTIL
jgi:hypothetical protein